MKRNQIYRPVAMAVLLTATALPLNPALAQVVDQAAPPPVEAPTTAAPAPEPTPAPAAQAPVFAPRQEVVQPTPPRPVVAPEATAEPAAAPVASKPRQVAKSRMATPRPVARAASPVATPVPAAAPVAEPVAPTPPVAAEPISPPPPVEATPVPETTTPAQLQRDNSLWMWGVAALAGLAALLGFLFFRRSRQDAGYGSPTYVAVDEEGAPVPEVNLSERPWIRLMLQPIRAEMRGDEQTVDYELIVENEGRVPAHDVRVSSFLTGVKGVSMQPAFVNSQAQTHRIDLEPGASMPLSGKVTVREGVDPKIVADARYPLPDGTEGHLAARFGIDMSTPEPAAEVEDVLERV